MGSGAGLRVAHHSINASGAGADGGSMRTTGRAGSAVAGAGKPVTKVTGRGGVAGHVRIAQPPAAVVSEAAVIPAAQA